MSDFLRSYLTVAIFGAAAIGMVAAMLGRRPPPAPHPAPGPRSTSPTSRGVDPVGTEWSQSQVRYYFFALLFVMFDVEALYIFPWAMRLEVYDVFGLVEMGIFIVILALGLLYAWRKGVLKWV